jgi:hypothetical protein
LIKDRRVGIWHLTAFEKIAVIFDVGRVIYAIKIFKFAIPFPVKSYRNEALPEVKSQPSQIFIKYFDSTRSLGSKFSSVY